MELGWLSELVVDSVCGVFDGERLLVLETLGNFSSNKDVPFKKDFFSFKLEAFFSCSCLFLEQDKFSTVTLLLLLKSSIIRVTWAPKFSKTTSLR